MDRKAEAICVREAMRWLEDHPRDRPFFLRLSFNAPHTPVVPPYPFDRLVRKEDVAYPAETEGPGEGQPEWLVRSLKPFADASFLTRDQILEARRYYYGEAAFADYQFGQLLEWMRKRGMLDNTIVVFLSDHGTHIGDRGMLQKQTFYNEVVQVPYMFWWPGRIAAGKRIRTPVEIRTMLPTVMELAGIEAPERCRELSLAHTLRDGTEPDAKPVFCEFTLGTFGIRREDRLVMVLDGGWKMTAWVDAGEALRDGTLHDLSSDPYETRNLFGQPAHAEEERRLGNLILQHLRGCGSSASGS